MKRFLTSMMAVAALSFTATAQTTVQGIPWNGPARAVTQFAAPVGEARVIDQSQVEYWTGTGSNVSYLVIQWNSDLETRSHVFGYRFDGEKTGWNMISEIVAAHPQLYMLTHYTSLGYTVAGLGLDVNGNGMQLLSFDGHDGVRPDKDNSYVQTNAYDYDNWTAVDTQDLWNSGWTKNGYWSYYVKDSLDADFEYSQKGASSRKLTNGSVDGWMFNPLSGSTNTWKPASYDSAPWTDTTTIDGITYRPVNTMGVGTKAFATVAPATDNAYTGEVTVPATVTISDVEHTVTAVESNAFAASAITSFTASSPNLYLADDAFKDCESLTAVNLSEEWGGPWWSEGVFSGCSSLTQVPLPSIIVNIPNRYAEGTALTELVVPESVKWIGTRAFATPTLLTVKNLHREPTACASDAFSPFEGKKLIVPLGCRDLYANADGWRDFTDIEEEMPEGYVPVGTKFQVGDLWYEVTSNEPNEVCVAYPGATTPNTYAYNLTNSYNDVADKIFTSGGSNGREWQLRLPEKVQYPEKGEFTVTGIGRFAFAKVNCPTSKNLTIKTENGGFNENIRSIGAYAFAGNNSSGFYLPPMVDSIGDYAFSEMNELITLDCDNPEPPITEIPAGMCNNDQKLRYCVPLYYGKVTKVGEKAFYYHPKDFHVERTLSYLEEVGNQAFYQGYSSSSDFVYPIPVTDKLRKIGTSAFYGSQLSVDGGTTFTMHKDGVYGTRAMQSINGIEKIVIEDGVTEVPAELFQYIDSLSNIELPASLETIGSCAFLYAKGLKEIVLPEGLKTIADRAFRGTSLVKVDLPASVEVCDGLWAIDTLQEINIPEDSKLRSASSFGQTAISTIFIPDGVTELPTFGYCENLTGFTGAKNVTRIPNNAFSGDISLTSALIPEKTIYIGDFAWSYCTGIKEIIIPEGVSQLGGRIAYQATSLERIVLPSTVKTLDGTWGTFSGIPATTDLWMCSTDYTNMGYYASYVIPEIPFGSYAGQHFAHYYVLSGMKAKADAWAGNNFTTTEVNLGVGFPEQHLVTSTYNKDSEKSDVAIEVIPVVTLEADGLTESEIPTAFMEANMKAALTNQNGKAMFTGEFRISYTEDSWTPFDVEVVAPDMEASTLPEWKYIMKTDGLLPGEEYEYTLSRLNGQLTEPENVVRYFTAAQDTSVGVEEIGIAEEIEAMRIYDIEGNQLPALRKGLNIVIDKNGKAHKILKRN